jgi:hypothetical protein
MAEWIVKSESDTDRVWVEVDDKGRETGEIRYEFATADGSLTVVPERAKRTAPLWSIALGAAIGTAAIEIARRVVG